MRALPGATGGAGAGAVRQCARALPTLQLAVQTLPRIPVVSAFPSPSPQGHLASSKLQTSCVHSPFAGTGSVARGPGSRCLAGKGGQSPLPSPRRGAQQPCPTAMRCAAAPCSPRVGRGPGGSHHSYLIATHQASLTTRSTALKPKHHRKRQPRVCSASRRGFEFTGQTSPRERCRVSFSSPK